MGGWEDVLVLEEGEFKVASWKATVHKNGENLRTERDQAENKIRYHVVVLTNRRLAFFGNDGFLYTGKNWEFVDDIPLESIKGLEVGGRLLKHFKLRTAEAEFKIAGLLNEGESVYGQQSYQIRENFKTKIIFQKGIRERQLASK